MNSNIEFNEEQQAPNPRFLYSKFQASTEKPGVVNFLINHKIVKDERGANSILMGITVLFIVLSVFLFMYGNGSFSGVKPDNVSVDPFNRLN
jgi:hypothetical protein